MIEPNLSLLNLLYSSAFTLSPGAGGEEPVTEAAV